MFGTARVRTFRVFGTGLPCDCPAQRPKTASPQYFSTRASSTCRPVNPHRIRIRCHTLTWTILIDRRFERTAPTCASVCCVRLSSRYRRQSSFAAASGVDLRDPFDRSELFALDASCWLRRSTLQPERGSSEWRGLGPGQVVRVRVRLPGAYSPSRRDDESTSDGT